MGKFYFGVGQAKTSHVDGSQIVLAYLPGLQNRLNVMTYAGQILPGHEIVVQLASPQTVASWLLPAVRAGLEAKAAQEYTALEQRASQLKAGVDKLNETEADRIGPFLNYAWRSARGGGSVPAIREKIQKNEQLTSPDIDAIVSLAHGLLKHQGATSAVKDRIRTYIKTGEADADLIAFLGRHIEEFASFSEYNETLAKLRQGKGVAGTSSAPIDLSSLEQKLLQGISLLRSGAASGNEIEGGVKTSYFSLLCSMLGTEPAKYFACKVTGILEGRVQSGLVAPLTLKPGQSVPEELRQQHLPTQKFEQLLSVIDKALSVVGTAYIRADEYFFRDDIEIAHHIMPRAIIPDNPALKIILSPQVPVSGATDGERLGISRVADCYKNGDMVRLAASRLGLSEAQLNQDNFKRLIALQDNLLPLLPYPFHEFGETMKTAEKFQSEMESELKKPGGDRNRYKFLLINLKNKTQWLRNLEQELRDNFGFNLKTAGKVDEKASDECLGWIGNDYGFIRYILACKTAIT